MPLSEKAKEWVIANQMLINSVAAGEGVFTYRKTSKFLHDTKSKKEQKELLKKWVDEGVSEQEMAENLGITRQAVYQRMVKFGLRQKTIRKAAAVNANRVIANTDGKLKKLRLALLYKGYTGVAACRHLGFSDTNLLNKCISGNKKLTEAEYNALLDLLKK